ncbi:MAG: hypothetical protein Mars2KO_07750 [Maribacter sp.]
MKGINFGIIIDIPFVNIKCPIAVNRSIVDIAILADRAKSYSFLMILIAKMEIAKLNNSTISVFMSFEIIEV